MRRDEMRRDETIKERQDYKTDEGTRRDCRRDEIVRDKERVRVRRRG